jgi:hypothetical protein
VAESDETVIALLLEMRADLRAMREAIATRMDADGVRAAFGGIRDDLRSTVVDIRGTVAATGERLCAELDSLRRLVEQNRSELETSVRPRTWRLPAGFQ